METARLDLFELKTGDKIKEDYEEMDAIDIYFIRNGIKDEVLIAYVKEYNKLGTKSKFVEKFLYKIFDDVNYDYRVYEDDIHHLYLKCCEELSKRYIAIFENVGNSKVEEKELREELIKEKYKCSYSEDNFKKKLKAFGNKIGSKILHPAVLLFNVLQDENTPLEIKGTIVAGLGYFICPIDLIADVVPVVGYTDDLGALTLTISLVKSYITPEIERKTENDLNKLFR